MRYVKKIFMSLALVVCVLASVLGHSNSVQAKSGKTKYLFAPSEVTTFKLKNNKLTIITDKKVKGKCGIYKSGDKKHKKYKVTYKVAKNCKWVVSSFDRYNGGSSSSKSSYKKIKGYIKDQRTFYKSSGYSGNVGLSSFVVKNKKIIKVEYLEM